MELNRRLSPDVYLGVTDVHDPDGQPCEHLVVMRRMPDERRLSVLTQAVAPLERTVDDIARMMARFHAAADRSDEIAQQGSREATRQRWRENLEALRPDRQEVLSAELVDELRRRAERFLAGRDALFAERVADGRVMDGHGDLLADDVFCLDDGPRLLDCLDFDRLRCLDGLDDVACLAMDLEHHGNIEQAQRLLDRYTAAADDPAPPELRHHYVAYRALMRAKVDCLRYAQGDSDAAEHAQQHAELARTHLQAGSVRLILVGGSPGTGKSTLATALADRLSARLHSSDQVRKELAGIERDRTPTPTPRSPPPWRPGPIPGHRRTRSTPRNHRTRRWSKR